MAPFPQGKLKDFFQYYDPENPKHRAAVDDLERVIRLRGLEKELLDDEANWVRIHRTPAGDKKPPQDASILLPVPFFNQLDNYTDPHRTCNSSACAMLLAYMKPGVIKNDDEYLKRVLSIGATVDHVVQTKALRTFGLETKFLTNMQFADIDEQLDKKRPVVISFLHRGTLENPTGGHVAIVVGKKNQDYILHDPYGSLLDQYTGPITNGKYVTYPRSILQKRWLPDNRGWGRVAL